MTSANTLTSRKARWEPTDDVAAMAPGQIMRDRRERLGLRQGELAYQLSWENPNFISMLEKGWSYVPIEKAPEIADVLRLPKHWFVERVMAAGMPRKSGLHALYYGVLGALRQAYEVDLARAALEMKPAPQLA